MSTRSPDPARAARRDLGDVPQQLAAIDRMTVSELRERWLELYGEPTRNRNRRWLQKRLAFRIQELAEGGLSDRARRRIDELTKDLPLAAILNRRRRAAEITKAVGGAGQGGDDTPTRDPRLPPPGSVITKEFRGATLEVEVLDDGFEFRGETYRSLSAIARAATGTHWNGVVFFGLTKRTRRPAGAAKGGA